MFGDELDVFLRGSGAGEAEAQRKDRDGSAQTAGIHDDHSRLTAAAGSRTATHRRTAHGTAINRADGWESGQLVEHSTQCEVPVAGADQSLDLVPIHALAEIERDPPLVADVRRDLKALVAGHEALAVDADPEGHGELLFVMADPDESLLARLPHRLAERDS